MIKMMLLAGTGGFFGTCLRFLTGRLCAALGATLFPWATFVVNVIGSFVIGVLFGAAERTQLITSAMNALLITGFCGGFTTFSSFSHDMLTLIEQRSYLYFALYTVLSLVVGLVMVWAGRAVVVAKVANPPLKVKNHFIGFTVVRMTSSEPLMPSWIWYL